MTVTTSLAKAFSFTFNVPSKTAILPRSGDLSNQQIGSIVLGEWRLSRRRSDIGPRWSRATRTVRRFTRGGLSYMPWLWNTF
jgi:hypothetical protein